MRIALAVGLVVGAVTAAPRAPLLLQSDALNESDWRGIASGVTRAELLITTRARHRGSRYQLSWTFPPSSSTPGNTQRRLATAATPRVPKALSKASMIAASVRKQRSRTARASGAASRASTKQPIGVLSRASSRVRTPASSELGRAQASGGGSRDSGAPTAGGVGIDPRASLTAPASGGAGARSPAVLKVHNVVSEGPDAEMLDERLNRPLFARVNTGSAAQAPVALVTAAVSVAELAHWMPFVQNHVDAARRGGFGYFVLTGGLPAALEAVPPRCKRVRTSRLSGGEEVSSTQAHAIGRGHVKAAALLLTLDEPRVRSALWLELHSALPQPVTPAALEAAALEAGASVNFGVRHDLQSKTRTAPEYMVSGNSLAVRNDARARRFLRLWLGKRCGRREDQSLWEAIVQTWVEHGCVKPPPPRGDAGGARSRRALDIVGFAADSDEADAAGADDRPAAPTGPGADGAGAARRPWSLAAIPSLFSWGYGTLRKEGPLVWAPGRLEDTCVASAPVRALVAERRRPLRAWTEVGPRAPTRLSCRTHESERYRWLLSAYDQRRLARELNASLELAATHWEAAEAVRTCHVVQCGKTLRHSTLSDESMRALIERASAGDEGARAVVGEVRDLEGVVEQAVARRSGNVYASIWLHLVELLLAVVLGGRAEEAVSLAPVSRAAYPCGPPSEPAPSSEAAPLPSWVLEHSAGKADGAAGGAAGARCSRAQYVDRLAKLVRSYMRAEARGEVIPKAADAVDAEGDADGADGPAPGSGSSRPAS